MPAVELLPHWDEILPSIFSDNRRFRQTSRSRYHANIDGSRAGIVVAWRTISFDNHALGQEDFQRLLELKRNGTFAHAFVVAAKRIQPFSYVAHRDAEELWGMLESVLPRAGTFGNFWLLREDLSPFDFASSTGVPF
jgi:hypothetical protein